MAIIRSLVVGAVMAAALAGPVLAQQKEPSKNPLLIEEEQKRKDDAAVDRQYKATLERVKKNGAPAETRSADPWQNMRNADDSKAKR